MMNAEIYENKTDKPLTIKVGGYEIRLDPFRRAEVRRWQYGKLCSMCLAITPIPNNIK